RRRSSARRWPRTHGRDDCRCFSAGRRRERPQSVRRLPFLATGRNWSHPHRRRRVRRLFKAGPLLVGGGAESLAWSFCQVPKCAYITQRQAVEALTIGRCLISPTTRITLRKETRWRTIRLRFPRRFQP